VNEPQLPLYLLFKGEIINNPSKIAENTIIFKKEDFNSLSNISLIDLHFRKEKIQE